MMNLSREYRVINKTVNGEIIVASLGRKGDVMSFVLTNKNPIGNSSTMKKFNNFDELLLFFSFDFEWFKTTEFSSDYNYINECYYSEKSKYGNGNKNRINENAKVEKGGF